jgi:hypothetical protein
MAGSSSCRNLLFELLDMKNITSGGESYLEEHILTRLNKGKVLTDCGNCCPSCGDTYILGDAYSFLFGITIKFFDLYPAAIVDPNQNTLDKITSTTTLATLPCCANIKGDELIEEVILTSLPLPVTDCNNGFNTCLTTLQGLLSEADYNTLLANGIAEYSNVLGGTNSFLCRLIQEIQTSPAYSSLFLFNVLSLILDAGVVVYCDTKISFVGSVSSFCSFAEALGISDAFCGG